MTHAKQRITFFLLSLVPIGAFAIDLFVPSLPNIAIDLSASISQVKQTVPMYLLGFGVSQLFYGPISDTTGRKIILQFGLLLFVVSSALCAMTQTIELLIAFRILQGLGAGASNVNCRAMMRDAFRGKAMAKISAQMVTVWAVTPVIAPVIGGYIQTYLGWRANFGAMFTYTGIIWILAWIFLPETLDAAHKKPFHPSTTLKQFRKLFTDKIFLSFGIMSSCSLGYFVTYATVSPFLFQNKLHYSPLAFGWMLLLFALGTILGSVLCRLLLNRVKIIHIIMLGSSITTIASCIFLLFEWIFPLNIYSLIALPFFGAIGAGAVFPNCTTGAITPHKRNAGTAGAAFGFLQIIGSFVFTFVVSHLPSNSALPLALVLAAIALISLITHLLVIRTNFQEEI